jgi:drug/metabolite transporter (DMT)-like permease
MLLSVIVYKHKLTSSQWLGAAIVFAGISVEAWFNRNSKTSVLLSSANLIFPTCFRGPCKEDY